MELDLIRREHFEAHLGQVFRLVVPDGGELELTLLQARELGGAPQDRRPPFSVLWRGPAAPLLAQGIYLIEAPGGEASLGRLEIFIVPVGRADGPGDEGNSGMLYEAVFT